MCREEVESGVRPANQVRHEEHFAAVGAGVCTPPEVIATFQQVGDNVGRIVQQQDQDSNPERFGPPRQHQERKRGDVVRKHDEVVEVPRLVEPVVDSGKRPERELQQIERPAFPAGMETEREKKNNININNNRKKKNT